MANESLVQCDNNELGLPNDFKCPGNQVCFAKYHSWNTQNVAFCGCSTWFGFQGKDCQTLGIPAILSITWAVLLAIAYLYSATRLIISFLELKKKGKLGKNALTKSYVEVIIAGIALMFFEIFNAASTASPAGATQQFGYYPLEKFSQFQIVHRVFLTIGFTISYAGYSSMSLVWYDVASKSKRLVSKSTQFVNRLRYVVLASQVIYFIGIVYFYAMNQYTFLAVWVSIFMLILSISFYFCGKQMKQVLEDCVDPNVSGNGKDLQNALKMIIITSQIILASTFIHVIFGSSLIVVLFHDWREYWVPSPIQYFSLPLMLSDIEMGGFCMIHMVVSWYLLSLNHSSTTKTLSHANSKDNISRANSKETQRPLSTDMQILQSSTRGVVPIT